MFVDIVRFECSSIICLTGGHVLPVMSVRALSLGKRCNCLSHKVLVKDIALCGINSEIFATQILF